MSELRGQIPDEIVRSLPHLKLAQVHSALAYCFDHRDAILQDMGDDDFANPYVCTTPSCALQLERPIRQSRSRR